MNIYQKQAQVGDHGVIVYNDGINTTSCTVKGIITDITDDGICMTTEAGDVTVLAFSSIIKLKLKKNGGERR